MEKYKHTKNTDGLCGHGLCQEGVENFLLDRYFINPLKEIRFVIVAETSSSIQATAIYLFDKVSKT